MQWWQGSEKEIRDEQERERKRRAAAAKKKADKDKTDTAGSSPAPKARPKAAVGNRPVQRPPGAGRYGLLALPGLQPDVQDSVLCDASDPTALARALVELAASVNRQKLAVAARHRAVKYYGWDSHCRKLEQGIRDALNRRTSVG